MDLAAATTVLTCEHDFMGGQCQRCGTHLDLFQKIQSEGELDPADLAEAGRQVFAFWFLYSPEYVAFLASQFLEVQGYGEMKDPARGSYIAQVQRFAQHAPECSDVAVTSFAAGVLSYAVKYAKRLRAAMSVPQDKPRQGLVATKMVVHPPGTKNPPPKRRP